MMSMTNIRHEIFKDWISSPEYTTESYLENGGFVKHEDIIKGAIGDKSYHDVSDQIVSLACESEEAGFQNGFRYGIAFLHDMLKGGDQDE